MIDEILYWVEEYRSYREQLKKDIAEHADSDSSMDLNTAYFDERIENAKRELEKAIDAKIDSRIALIAESKSQDRSSH